MKTNAINSAKGIPSKETDLQNYVNTSKLLKMAIANGNTTNINKYNKAHNVEMKKLVGHCPYCDPNWNDVPNFPESMKGYDVPMGNPDPGV